jgi:hypothetical protein
MFWASVWHIDEWLLRCSIEPLLEVGLCRFFDNLFDDLPFHRTPMFSEFLRSVRRGHNTNKYFGSGEVLKGLNVMYQHKVPSHSRDVLTVIKTSRVQRTIPILPPFTWTGADEDARTWSRKISKSISKLKWGCPDVLMWTLAINKHIEGYDNPIEGCQSSSKTSCIKQRTIQMKVARAGPLRFRWCR